MAVVNVGPPRPERRQRHPGHRSRAAS
jgi:hypothetical protein